MNRKSTLERQLNLTESTGGGDAVKYQIHIRRHMASTYPFILTYLFYRKEIIHLNTVMFQVWWFVAVEDLPSSL